jgi:hypothetical protein
MRAKALGFRVKKRYEGGGHCWAPKGSRDWDIWDFWTLQFPFYAIRGRTSSGNGRVCSTFHGPDLYCCHKIKREHSSTYSHQSFVNHSNNMLHEVTNSITGQ